MEYVLRTKNLTKKFKGIMAVDHVNMCVKQGDIYGFIGKNGAGKSTFMKMVCGMFIPSQGEIELFENKSLSVGRKKIGSIIEEPAFYPSMTAKENLEYYSIISGKKNKVNIEEALEFVGLTAAADKMAKEFSLGMKQRLAIAIAFIGNADFLILDEPINGLDPKGIKEIRELLLKLNKVNHITILISSHILGELSKIATRYGVIEKGVLVDEFDKNQLAERCKKYIKLEVDNSEKTKQILTTKIGLHNVKVIDHHIINIFDDFNDLAQITKVLVMNDIAVSGLSKVGKEFEDYFIGLMGGE